MNPLNQMPSLPQTPLSAGQGGMLGCERTESSIARDGREKWEYPSSQQFYNALVRKGWETPVEHVDTMVEIHNFLNERAWGEVLRWEKRVARCGSELVGRCGVCLTDVDSDGDEEPHLARFKGRPGEMSPKARAWMFMGWLLPTRFRQVSLCGALADVRLTASAATSPRSTDTTGSFDDRGRARRCGM